MTPLYDFASRCVLLALWVLVALWIVLLGVLVAPVVRDLWGSWRLHRSMDRYQRDCERRVWR